MAHNNRHTNKLEDLEKSLEYNFKNKKLLENALTHSSYVNEHKMKTVDNNERLEFLGDSVLNLVVSNYLFDKYGDYPEGELTKIRAKVVCEYSLAYAARKIDLGSYLLLGKGEETTGGYDRDSILSDAMEAVVGAIYKDCGFEKATELLIKNFEEDIVFAVNEGVLFTDYKTDLQENLQKLNKSKIEYKVVKEEGPDHNKVFYIDLILDNDVVGTGVGKNKKEAEQMAAKEALVNLEDSFE